MTKFTDFGLAQPLLKALADEGYTTPTPVQLQAMPGALAGKDMMVSSNTGSGKTACFVLPGLTDQGDGIAADLQGLPTVGLKVGRTARPGPAAALPLR